MQGWIARLMRDQDGVAAVEFALVAPVMMVMLVGTFEVTEVLRCTMNVTNAAQGMADLIARSTSVTNGTPGVVGPTIIGDFCNAAKFRMGPFSTSALGLSMDSVYYDGLTRYENWSSQDTTSCGTGTTIASPVTLATPYLSNTGDSVIIVQATYHYVSPIKFILPKHWTLTATAYARPRDVVYVNWSSSS
jgi:Flp pilus assembly protein TadG